MSPLSPPVVVPNKDRSFKVSIVGPSKGHAPISFLITGPTRVVALKRLKALFTNGRIVVEDID